MKKFLSLVLALVMTMSLVTISAGATEYKDLTDKDEIQYEEAVAVLNRIGIITGYEDGSFRPETELTRGAAAKIIVSLMIGPEAASALPNNESPYPDVPAGHTFAGVIGYCKTAGYISGYGDGTFKPANSLTGYAFAKMLLGALGYKSSLEGFTGTGWTMNVARLGNAAGLFNRLSFQGADAVNREEACQLALNTLKATMVEYTGGFNITAGDASVVGAQTRTYVTSNQAYAKNIDNRKAEEKGNSKDVHYTVEFGEEHFKDLRLNDEHENARDSFGRPSNEWSYKKVTIGTFPIAADFTFDKQMAHVDKTDAVKNRATGLSGYELTDGAKSSPKYTTFWINGVKYELNAGKWGTQVPATFNAAEIKSNEDAKIANISDLTDNGTVVEVYVSEDVADFITDVVVVQTQLMEVRRIGSDYVSLQREGDDDSDDIKNNAYNMQPIEAIVDDVKIEDSAYSVLSELKEGDVVAVVPLAQNSDPSVSTKYDVAAAYVPETVKGALTGVETYGTLTSSDKDPVNVTVGGSVYPIALWSRDLKNIDGDSVKMTRKDVTLYLDKNGNALKAEDVGSTDGWMVIGRYYEDVVDRHLVTMVEGWDTSGEKLELNLGNFRNNWKTGNYTKGYAPGDLVRYESTTKGNAEWEISVDQGKNHVVPVDIDAVDAYSNDRIEKSDVRVPLLTKQGGAQYDQHENVYVDSTGIKFVFVTYESDGSGEVESVEVKKGVQEVSVDELKDFYDRSTAGDAAGAMDSTGSAYTHAQAGYTTTEKNGWTPDQVKVVVIKSESNDAEATNLMYIRDQVGGATKLSDGTMVYHYTVVMLGPDGYFSEEVRIASDDNVKTDTFVSYSQKEIENYSGSETCYDLRDHSNFVGRVASTFQADLFQMVNSDKGFVRLAAIDAVKGTNDAAPSPEIMDDIRDDSTNEFGGDKGVIRIYNAKFADLRSQAHKRATREITSYKDLKWLVKDADAGIKLDASGDGYVAAGEETLELQIVVNDKVGNANFREAALVVITDQRDATATVPAKTGNDVTLSIEGITGSWKNTSTVKLTTAQLGALATKKITLAPSDGATIASATPAGGTFAVTAVAGSNNTQWTISAAPADTNTLTVVVQSQAGASATHVFTVAEDTGLFTWSGLTADMATAKSTLKNQDLTDISGLIFVDDGTEATMVGQAKEALKHLGVDVDEDSVELLPDGKIAYTYTTPKGNVLTASFTPDIDLIKVTVGETPKYVDVSAGAVKVKALDGLTIGNVRETKADGTTVVDHKGALSGLDQAADVVLAGSTYEDAAFVTYAAPEATGATGFTPVAKVGQKTLSANDVIELTDTVTITLTATAKKNQAAPVATAAKFEFSVNTDKNGAVKGDATFELTASEGVTASAGTITFKAAATGDIIVEDDTLTCEYSVAAPTDADDLAFQAKLAFTAGSGTP